jgi:eukaryotic-like serine/threonine-protein kinase
MTNDRTLQESEASRRERALIENARRRVRGGGDEIVAKESSNSQPPVSSTEFVAAVLKSRLLDRKALKERAKQFRSQGDNHIHPTRQFAKFLIEHGDLTPYQVERLLAGRSEGFFLGDCRILGVLGAGGMGKVYLAEQMRLGRQVAVKVLSSHRADDPSARARFLREARAAAELKHLNIVQIYDVGETRNTLYIIMELVRGLTLADRLKQQGPMSVAESTAVIRQVATGLQHAHEHRIVHRDIKPSNLVLEENTVKILDLGLARKSDADDSMTQDGSGLGTPDYMSPEQFVDAHNADVRSDLYSLGCTWYYLLTGQPPFPGSGAVQKGFHHINTAPPDIQSLVPSVPDCLAAVIARLMAKRPEDRYQTPTELLAELGDWSGTVSDDDATRKWNMGDNTPLSGTINAGPGPDVSISTPAPAENPDSETLITAPATSIPSFLLYLIPVMGALVLGGAYFGIRALLDKQGTAEPLVVRIPNPAGDGGGHDAATSDSRTNGNRVDVLDQSNTDQQQDSSISQPPVEADAANPPVDSIPPQGAAVVEQSTPETLTPPSPARPPRTWQFTSVSEWQAARNDILEGDHIELQGGLYEFAGEELTFDVPQLTLAAADGRGRPVIRWTLPGDRRFSDGLVQVAHGRLVIEGIDFYVDLENQNATDSAMTLFRLDQSDLHLIDSSVTVMNPGRLPVTVVSLNGERPWDAQAGGDPPAPVLAELRNSLIRATDSVVAVDSRHARIAVENTIVCGRGSLVHVFHTRPLEFAHHGLRLEVRSSILDVAGPVVMVDCRPFELHPVSLAVDVASSLVLGPSASLPLPPQLTWDSPVETDVISTAIRWTGRENHFFQRGDGLTARTASGPVITLVQSPDDWKLQGLGDAVGWNIVPRLRPPHTPYERRRPDDYNFARDLGIDLKNVANPASRRPR